MKNITVDLLKVIGFYFGSSKQNDIFLIKNIYINYIWGVTAGGRAFGSIFFLIKKKDTASITNTK